MKGSGSKLSKFVQDALDRIRISNSPKELGRYYDNVKRNRKITDTEQELLLDAIRVRLSGISPSDATKRFGPKDDDAHQFLQKTLAALSEKYDLSGNQVKNSVKVGGAMIKGDVHVDRYISCKNADGLSVSLSWLQDTVETEHYLIVSVRQVRGEDPGTHLTKRFEAGQEDAAAACYEEELAKVLQ